MSAAAATPRNTQAEGQIAKANELLAEIALVNGEYANQVWAELKARWAVGTCTFEFVSGQIKAMIDAKRSSRRLASVPSLPQVADGRYAVEHEGVLKFYRVTRKGGYKLFVYASDNQHLVSNFNTMLDVLRLIEADEADGTKAAQLRFGRKFGRCYSCGRGLTDPISREAGQGPDCRAK